MALVLKLGVLARNAMLDAIETTVGLSGILRIYDGSIPADCAASITGALLAEVALASDWMNVASTGTKTFLGAWADPSANATGTATHFRIWNTGVTVCSIQGSVGTATCDMIVDNTSFSAGQSFTVNSFTLTAPNA